MVVGRGTECARIDALLADARSGRSGTLVVRGDAGIGKSALLEHARERAEGLAVLRCRGVESEAELPFAALGDLFRPVLDHLEAIPERQAAALAGALAIGPPVGGDRFAACAATLSLLAAVAEETPVLALVDDAQWLDASSAEALAFAARRLDAEAVALILAVRDGPATVFDRAELPELRLLGLDDEAARELVVRGASAVSPAMVGRLLELAAGNPLALVELPAALSEAQLRGDEPLDEQLPAVPAVERAFLRQVEALPEESQSALVVAAASDSGALLPIMEALRVLGIDPHALDAAEEQGLVAARDDRVEFRHPLLRAAVYRSASHVDRQEAHQALARAAVGEEHADRRAWHLAAAAPAHDETAALALDQAALSARRRGGRAEAASAFERAADLSADEAERARRLREAAHDAWLVGRLEKALELLDSALLCVRDPVVRARVQHLRGAVEMWRGTPLAAHALLVEEAARVEALDAGRAAKMLTDAAWASLMGGEIGVGVTTAERAAVVAAGVGGEAEGLPKALLGIGLMLGGDSRRAVELFSGYVRLLDEPAEPQHVYQAFRPDGQVLTWFEQYEQARASLTRTVDSARAHSALGVLPYALAAQSDLDFRTGNWAAAYAGAAEAVRIADETEQKTTLAFSLACLGRVQAAQGREEECRAHLQRATALAYPSIASVVAFAGAALGLLELGLGQTDSAVVHLEAVERQAAGRGLRETAVIQWAPDLMEAYIRSGREEDARRRLADFERAATATERNWALAAAARCRGLLADEDGFENEFRAALELHERTPTPFERARTQLALGERLRRARRRAEARLPLRAALETFERLGAVPWAERARTELAASGETVGRRDPYAAEQLTPQELQVAFVVAKGATNKEAGAALFLSPKTIETHLGRVYRKLGVRSRTELARLLASEGALGEAA